MHTDQRPTLRQLMILKSHSKRDLKIIDKIALDWKNFGKKLYVPAETLKCIEMTCRYKGGFENFVMECCSEVMKVWLMGLGRLPVTWATFIEVLKESEYSELAKNVEEVVLSLRDDGKVWDEGNR